MVVGQIDIVDVAGLKAERDSPVGGNPNTPEALHLTLEWVQAVAGSVQIFRADSSIETGQDLLDPLYLIGPQLALVVALEEPLQTSVPERPEQV